MLMSYTLASILVSNHIKVVGNKKKEHFFWFKKKTETEWEYSSWSC